MESYRLPVLQLEAQATYQAVQFLRPAIDVACYILVEVIEQQGKQSKITHRY